MQFNIWTTIFQIINFALVLAVLSAVLYILIKLPRDISQIKTSLVNIEKALKEDKKPQ